MSNVSMSTEQRLFNVLDLLLKDKGYSVSIDSNMDIADLPNMDSLFFLEMVVVFEKEFDVKFKLEDLVGQKNIKSFIDIIEAQII